MSKHILGRREISDLFTVIIDRKHQHNKSFNLFISTKRSNSMNTHVTWKDRESLNHKLINPIPAGVLENQNMLGGVNLTSPSKSHILCPNMTNDTSLESSCALLLESAKNLHICKN